MGLLEQPPSSSFKHGTQLPPLFPGAPGDSALCSPSYLVTYEGTKVRVRAVPQVAGGTRYAVDQLENQDSIEVTPTAWHSPDLLVHGRIATVSDSKPAKRMYGAFARALERHFKRINAVWVGPEAEAAWKRGARLAIGASSPREYDLRELGGNAV